MGDWSLHMFLLWESCVFPLRSEDPFRKRLLPIFALFKVPLHLAQFRKDPFKPTLCRFKRRECAKTPWPPWGFEPETLLWGDSANHCATSLSLKPLNSFPTWFVIRLPSTFIVFSIHIQPWNIKDKSRFPSKCLWQLLLPAITHSNLSPYSRFKCICWISQGAYFPQSYMNDCFKKR